MNKNFIKLARSSLETQARLVLLLETTSEHGDHKLLDNKWNKNFKVIEIPDAISFLSDSTGRIVHSLEKPSEEEYVVIESIKFGNSLGIAVFISTGTQVFINGFSAPKVALLREKDELILHGAEEVAYVSLYQGNFLRRIENIRVGSTCPICRQAFVKNDFVYSCICGFTVHANDPLAKTLDSGCINSLPKCLDCDRLVNPTSNDELSYIPEGLGQ